MGFIEPQKNEIVALTENWMQLKILEVGEEKLDSFAYLLICTYSSVYLG